MHFPRSSISSGACGFSFSGKPSRKHASCLARLLPDFPHGIHVFPRKPLALTKRATQTVTFTPTLCTATTWMTLVSQNHLSTPELLHFLNLCVSRGRHPVMTTVSSLLWLPRVPSPWCLLSKAFCHLLLSPPSHLDQARAAESYHPLHLTSSAASCLCAKFIERPRCQAPRSPG